jgi:hypothetical protein
MESEWEEKFDKTIMLHNEFRMSVKYLIAFLVTSVNV